MSQLTARTTHHHRRPPVGAVPAPTTTSFSVGTDDTGERLLAEDGALLGVWDRVTGMGWHVGAEVVHHDGIDWFLACTEGRAPGDRAAGVALAEVRSMDYRGPRR